MSCVGCGAGLPDPVRRSGQRRRYCDDCRRDRQRAASAAHKERLRVIGPREVPEICGVCGGPIVHDERAGAKRRYCSDACSLLAQRGAAAAWRRRHPEQGREQQRAYVARLRRIVADAKRDGCARCGEPDPVVLDLHHVRGVKEFGIGSSTAVRVGEERLRAEITKCIVLCANCHRREHARVS